MSSVEQETPSSTVSSAAPSPQPLHNPSQAAVVHFPEAPLGNHTNGIAGPGGIPNAAMGQKALLAKKMAKGRYVGFPLLSKLCTLIMTVFGLQQSIYHLTD